MCIVVNLWGGPGCGKSTTMAHLFSELKIQGYNVEMVSEFAKDLVYENRMDTMKDELYIFAKQNHRLFRVEDKVDIIITDRPLPLTCVYDEVYGKNDKSLHELVRNTFNEYKNINILLEFNKDNYKTEGRLQDRDEALKLHNKIGQELIKTGKDYLVVGNNNIEEMIHYIKERLIYIRNTIKVKDLVDAIKQDKDKQQKICLEKADELMNMPIVIELIDEQGTIYRGTILQVVGHDEPYYLLTGTLDETIDYWK